jgi:PST family polysaccharide transporter
MTSQTASLDDAVPAAAAAPRPATRVAGTARQRAASSLLWTALESGGVSLLAVVTLVVFGWTLTPAELGIVALALSVVQLMNLPVELLCHDALIQRREVTRRHFDTAFTVSLLLGLALSGLCWLAGDLLAAEVGDPRVAPVLQWMSLSLPAMGTASALVSWHQREFNFRILALRTLVGRVGAALVAVGLALAGAGVWALVVFQVLGVALGSAVLWWYSRTRPRLGFGGAEFLQLSGFGLRVLAARGTEFAALPLFMVFVGINLGADAAGYFSLAHRTVEMLRAVVTDAFAKLALPLFARLQDSARLLRRVYESATGILCAATFPIFAGLAAVAPQMIVTVFGAKWAPAAPVMSGLCALAILVQARLYTADLLVSVARPQQVVPVRAAELLFLAAVLHAVPTTLPFVVVAWVARAALAMPLDVWLLRRAVRFPALRQFRPLLSPALLSALMAGGVLAVAALLPASLPAALRLAVEVGFGVALYVTGLVAVGHPLVGQVRRMLRSTARRRGAAA